VTTTHKEPQKELPLLQAGCLLLVVIMLGIRAIVGGRLEHAAWLPGALYVSAFFSGIFWLHHDVLVPTREIAWFGERFRQGWGCLASVFAP
jgi:hypothetical protein